MNKITTILLSALILALFSSCSDDTKNPVINPAAENGSLTYVLNKTRYNDWIYVLEKENEGSDMDALLTSQPDYGFTAAVTYFVQVSFNEEMSERVELPSPVQGERVNINVKEMNKAMFDLYGGDMPNPSVVKDVYVRLKAIVSNATKTPFAKEPTVKPLYSNTIKLKILPYYIENAKPYFEVPLLKPYFIVGYMGWNNSVEGLGSHVIPMSVVEGDAYNAEGEGKYRYTGFFEAGRGFKVIGVVGSWNEQWGNGGGDGIDNPVHNDGGSSNFAMPEEGYYTVLLNTITHEISFEKKEIEPKVYDNMGLVGEMTGWGESADIALKPYQDKNNHVWYAEYTFASDSQCKFRYNSDWGTNWGTASDKDGDPAYSSAGLGIPGGKNLIQKAGTYTIFFNDIDGSYMFIKK